MKLAIYCDSTIDNSSWIENQILEYIYFCEESISIIYDIKEIVIISPNDNITKQIAKIVSENRPKIQLSYSYIDNIEQMLVLLNQKEKDCPQQFITDKLNLNLRYYDEVHYFTYFSFK